MQIKKLLALIVLLIIASAVAVIYFNSDKKFQYRDSIELNLDDSLNFGGYNNSGYPEIDRTNDTIFQNVNLISTTKNDYSLSLKEVVSRETKTNRIMIDDTNTQQLFKTKSPIFYIVDTKAEGTKITRRLQDVLGGDPIDVTLAEYWILENAVSARTAVSLMIKTTDAKLITSGACAVTQIDKGDATYGGVLYEITFQPEKLTGSFANKYNNQSISGICGDYGPKNDSFQTLGSGKFYYENNVLVYFDQMSPWADWIHTDSELKITKI